jgi:hypothetical protein
MGISSEIYVILEESYFSGKAYGALKDQERGGRIILK